MVLQAIPAAGANATADSISIPVADLTAYGLTSAELTNNLAGKTRAVFSILKRIQAVLSAASGLIGVSVPTAPAFSTPGLNRNQYGYSLTAQYLVDVTGGEATEVPLPGSGSNSGVGGIAIANIFPGAAKVSAAAAVSGAALLIPTADLIAFNSGITHAGLNLASGQDNREAIVALYKALLADSLLRSATVASAFTASSFGALSSLTVPPAFTQTTNPTTGIDAASVANGSKGLLTQTISITAEILINGANDTTDVNIVTT